MPSHHVTKRAVPHVTEVVLLGMNTRQLGGRLARLRACQDSFSASDFDPHELEGCADILFKDDPAWEDAFEAVKRILATRAHVPRPAEARALRPKKHTRRANGSPRRS
jgi:hypothetical protein